MHHVLPFDVNKATSWLHLTRNSVLYATCEDGTKSQISSPPINISLRHRPQRSAPDNNPKQIIQASRAFNRRDANPFRYPISLLLDAPECVFSCRAPYERAQRQGARIGNILSCTILETARTDVDITATIKLSKAYAPEMSGCLCGRV